MFICACLFLVCCDPACRSSAFGSTLSALIMTEIRSQIIETWIQVDSRHCFDDLQLDKKSMTQDSTWNWRCKTCDLTWDLVAWMICPSSFYVCSFNTKTIKTVQHSQHCHLKCLCKVTWYVSECWEWLCHDWMTTLSVKLLAMLPDGPWIKSDHRHRACAKSQHFRSGLTRDLQFYSTQPVTWLDLPKNVDIWSRMSNRFSNLNQVLHIMVFATPWPYFLCLSLNKPWG